MSKTVLQLKPKAQRRFSQGHPWIFSNEVASVPKSLNNGEVVELKNSKNEFLAYGFGNRNSLICFRLLTRKRKDLESINGGAFWIDRLIKAAKLRKEIGLGDCSHRLCFGEADGIPGLIIDRYLLGSTKQAFVVQAQTAGADLLMPSLSKILEAVCAAEYGHLTWSNSAIVVKNSSEMRTLEGIKPEEPRVIREIEGIDLTNTKITVWGGLEFHVDLVNGQKTGFFLDQRLNVDLATRIIQPSTQSVKILDLCCYVGQWSKNLASHFAKQNCKVDLTFADASQKALDMCQKNLEGISNTKLTAMKADVMQDLSRLAKESFDIVVCDPPALIKSRKHLHAGERAYLKLNAEAMRLVRPGGWLITCSCSGLLDERRFSEIVAEASSEGERGFKIIAKGTQASDHPQLPEFPEGSYLKSIIAKATYS